MYSSTTVLEPGLYSARSVNNRVITEVYVPGALKAKVSAGYATVSQKVELKGLRLLIGTKLADGTNVPAGSIAFVKERILHTQQWAKDVYECEEIPEKFLIVDLTNIEFFSPPKGE